MRIIEDLNNWPHSVTVTRTKLLNIAHARAMEERHSTSSIDFMIVAKLILRRVLLGMSSLPCHPPCLTVDFSSLSHHLQRHDHTFHHLYFVSCSLASSNRICAPSTRSSSSLNTSQCDIHKSTARRLALPFLPLRFCTPPSTLSLPSSYNMHVDAEDDDENLFRLPNFAGAEGTGRYCWNQGQERPYSACYSKDPRQRGT
ncbi:hypothetical protein EDB19DRAFT_271074 [Suillus lakei]|nr:hypothetical protein EDB19DRAFT_271074 [Suillus lakei]